MQGLATAKVLEESRDTGKGYVVSSSQAGQVFGTSPPCDGEDLVSIAAIAWCSPHLSPTLPLSPQDLYSTTAQESYISPQGFHFPAAQFCCALAALPFASSWFGERGGAPWGCRASIALASLSLSLSLCTLLHKRHSVPCPQLTRLRQGPPFSSLVSSDQLTHAWLSITERSCVQVPGARTKPETACGGNVNTGTPDYLQKPYVLAYIPFHFTHMKCRDSVVSLVAGKVFFFFFPSTKERKICSEISWCNCKPHQLFWGLVGGSGKQSQFIFAADLVFKTSAPLVLHIWHLFVSEPQDQTLFLLIP